MLGMDRRGAAVEYGALGIHAVQRGHDPDISGMRAEAARQVVQGIVATFEDDLEGAETEGLIICLGGGLPVRLGDVSASERYETQFSG
jgi:hypothetical protein